MCGLAGILLLSDPREARRTPREAIPEEWLDILDASIAARGPDGFGRYRRRACADGMILDVAMVHRRLAILDLSPAGSQPMLTRAPGVPDDGRFRVETGAYGPSRQAPCPACARSTCVVFNGCIYNHREIRAELERAGHAFVSDHADTEVLTHGLAHWGDSLAEHLEGMYALAAFDGSGLTLMRDPGGQKPLYVYADRQMCVFASLPAGMVRLLRAMGRPITMDGDALCEWIALGYDAIRTPIAGIVQVAPGETLRYESGALQRVAHRPLSGFFRRRHIRREFLSFDRGGASALALVDRALSDAVARHLEADVPLSCFLSGGVDSSLIASYAMAHTGSLRTLCVRMPEAAYDESAHARTVADHIGSEHVEVEVATDPGVDCLDLIESLGLPFGDSSLLATHWVSRAAREIGGVALSGDGGDEMFLGYERYLAADHLTALWALGLLGAPLADWLLPRGDPRSRWDKAARLLAASRLRSYRMLLAIFPREELRRILGGDARRVHWRDGANSVGKARLYDLDHHLAGDMLRKVDHASMQAALEVRAPMLDSLVAQTCARIPTDRMLSDGRTTIASRRVRKGLLRRVARRRLPAEVGDRPKQGFGVSLGARFRDAGSPMGALLRDLLLDGDPFPALPLEIRRASVAAMIDEHAGRGLRRRDHSQRLYGLLVLSIWSRWLRRTS